MSEIFTANRHAIRICLSGDDPKYDRTIDIFPDRLKPGPGASQQDMILTLIAMGDHLEFGRYGGTHFLSAITDLGLTHPHGTYLSGAILCTDGFDADAPCVRFQDGTVHLPGGSKHPISDFAPRAYNPQIDQQVSQYLRDLKAKIPPNPVMSLVAGIAERIFPMPYTKKLETTRLKLCLLIAARAARLVQSAKTPAGKAGAEAACSSANDLINGLDWTWIAEPDRGYLPQTRSLGPKWAEIRGACDPELLQVGRDIHDALKDFDEDNISADVAIDPDCGSYSAHERIAFRSLLLQLDQAIMTCVPAHHLKPRAAKHAEQLLASADAEEGA